MGPQKTCIRLTTLIMLLNGLIFPLHAASPAPAKLMVTLLDENGSLLHSAHVYIFSSNKKKFFGTREASGMTTFELPTGEYRLYAGMTVKTNGIVDHFSSPEAKVSVSEAEPTSVILSLQKA